MRKKFLAQSITLGLLLASFAGSAHADKAPDVVTGDVNEFLNFDETKGTGLAKGKGVAVVSGDYPLVHFQGKEYEIRLDCEDMPNSISFKTEDAVTNVGEYGMVAMATTGDADLSINFEGKVLNINPALASPFTKSWWTMTRGGIYAGGASGGSIAVNIKATELNISPGTAAEGDPFDRKDNFMELLKSGAGIELNVGYDKDNADARVNIDLQGGDLNIKNMLAGIGVHKKKSVVEIKNAGNVNITSDEQLKVGNISNDTSEGVFRGVGLGATGGTIDITAAGSVNIIKHGRGIEQEIRESMDGAGAIRINAGRDVIIKAEDGGGYRGIHAVGPSKYAGEDLERKWLVDIAAGGKVSVEGYKSALIACNGGAGVRITAGEDISLRSLGEYGIRSWGNNNVSTRAGGDIELTSKTGTVYIEGSRYGIQQQERDGNITINGSCDIKGGRYGIQSSNTTGNLIFNGDVKIEANSDYANFRGVYIHQSKPGKFTVAGTLDITSGGVGMSIYPIGKDVFSIKRLKINAGKVGVLLSETRTGLYQTGSADDGVYLKGTGLDITAPVAIDNYSNWILDMQGAEGESSINGNLKAGADGVTAIKNARGHGNQKRPGADCQG